MEDIESSFSIELSSKEYLQKMTLNGNRDKGLVLEGIFGVIKDIEFLGESVLVITGSNGILRLDLEKEVLMKKLRQRRKKDE